MKSDRERLLDQMVGRPRPLDLGILRMVARIWHA